MINDMKTTQEIYNKMENHLVDSLRYATWPSQPFKKPTKWEKFKLKVNRVFGYRLVIKHKDDYCDCEEW